MTRVFVDANVIFAASYSGAGSSRELLRLAIRGEVELVVDKHVLSEAERNLARKAPEALAAFHGLLRVVPTTMIAAPSLGELQQAAAYVHPKDAPVVAAALKAGAEYLVTWDRKHFTDDPAVAERSGLKIVTPDELVSIVRRRDPR